MVVAVCIFFGRLPRFSLMHFIKQEAVRSRL